MWIGYGLMVLFGLCGYLYLRKSGKDWRFKNYLLIGAATGALCLFTGITERGQGQLGNLKELERSEVGQGSRQEQLSLTAEDVFAKRQYSVSVEEFKATETEAEGLFAKAKEELEQVILGDNASLEAISGNLNVPKLLAEGAVEVFCSFDPYELVNMEGIISWEELKGDAALVKVSARLICQEREALHEFYLRLVPPALTKEEALLKEVSQRLKEENMRQGQTMLKLPQEVNGISLHWLKPREETHLQILVLGILCMVVLYVYGREKAERERKAWERQMVLDYPDIVSQLSLLSGAGMTIPAAWAKLALEYRNQRAAGRIFLRPGYEELLKTWHELQDGVGEIKAYDNFGRRCDKPQYRKFASLLTQNLRKGTQGMQRLLDGEAEEAFRQRKAYAKQLGEEAGTKLLMPMGLMLLLVFAILLLPAMMTMGI